MSANIAFERKRVDCNALPRGWQREEVLRKSGISAGKVDVYYYSPTGKRVETKLQLARQLGSTIDVSNFDFQKGRFVHHLPLPSISVYRCSGNSSHNNNVSNNGGNINHLNCSLTITPAPVNSNVVKRKQKSCFNSCLGSPNCLTGHINHLTNVSPIHAITPTQFQSHNQLHLHHQQQQTDISRSMRTDASLVPPIRQTASIFKQPVTVIRNYDNSKTKNDIKQIGGQDKPKQLFWEKRLEFMHPCHPNGEQFDDVILPKILKPLGPNIHDETVVQSLATALHILDSPVTGQTATNTEFQKNAAAYINADQPLIQNVLITDDDIRRQDERVSIARRKLQEALKI